MRWFPTAFLTNGASIMTSAGLELTSNELRTKPVQESPKIGSFETLTMKKGAEDAEFMAGVGNSCNAAVI